MYLDELPPLDECSGGGEAFPCDGEEEMWKATTIGTGALLLAAGPLLAQTATVVDGNNIRVDGIEYRLYGIDAAESDQVCRDGWRAGLAAARYLAELVRAKNIVCLTMATDHDGRTAAICRAAGVDIGAAMVTGGHAVASVRHSARYVAQEEAAKAAERGIHAHDCARRGDYGASGAERANDPA